MKIDFIQFLLLHPHLVIILIIHLKHEFRNWLTLKHRALLFVYLKHLLQHFLFSLFLIVLNLLFGSFESFLFMYYPWLHIVNSLFLTSFLLLLSFLSVEQVLFQSLLFIILFCLLSLLFSKFNYQSIKEGKIQSRAWVLR